MLIRVYTVYLSDGFIIDNQPTTVETRYLEVGRAISYKFELPEVRIQFELRVIQTYKNSPPNFDINPQSKNVKCFGSDFSFDKSMDSTEPSSR